MVMLKEITNTFWGVTLNEGKRYSQTLEGVVHVSMAALDPKSNEGSDGPVSVIIQHNKLDFVLCSLNSGSILQQSLDLNFNEGEEVTFYLKGKGTVHLTGYIIPGDDDEYDSEGDEDFQPQSSFVDSDDDDNSSSEDDLVEGSKKRKKLAAVKQSKKPKVEIIDDDEEDDESLDGSNVDDDDDDDDEEDDDDEDGMFDMEAVENNKFLESGEEEEESDLDNEDEDSEEEEKASRKKKTEKGKKHQPAAAAKQSKETKDGKQKVEKPAENKEPAQSETGEKKKKKRKRNKKNKNKNESSSTAQSSTGSSSATPEQHVQAKSSSKVIEGVVIEDLKVGHGPEAKKGGAVHVYYSGKLANGKLFDAKISGKPFKFNLGKKQVIKGWEVGVEGMKVGGKRKLTIPPRMGYGSQNVGSIPPNSTLQFEVELKAVN